MKYQQIKAIEQKNKERILQVCPEVNEESGIYVFYRTENDIKYAYVGQAKKLLTRLASHLRGHSHIDLSLKKHGLHSKGNPTGYKIYFHHFVEPELDEREQEWIKNYAVMGYQLRNKTAGGQQDGKFITAETKPRKGYRDGLKQGWENARKEVLKFCKHFEIEIDNTAAGRRAIEKFNKFLKGENENE